MVELQPSKLVTRVRFPSPAPDRLLPRLSRGFYYSGLSYFRIANLARKTKTRPLPLLYTILTMKANRVLLYVQLIAMYLMHLPLYIVMVLVNLPSSGGSDDPIGILILVSLILSILVFLVSIVNAVFAGVSIFKGEESPTKTSMIVKLLLIPWYVMNFFFGFVLVAGFLNPWLFLAIPVLLAILIGSTYLFMLSTGLPDIAYIIRRGWTEKIKPSGLTGAGLVLLFLFCLDIVGAILIHIGTKKESASKAS